ncbi:carbohydrate kinase family protein [Amedibacillus dolichus]|uniref:Kinase, PfkB family n=1 Tax=Amedibacillus dolichus DSM 3991 TaxID=428127 RepID=A8R962_9FIRM|nr:carbohydrate kinase [Amedibacillus dolichus]EDP11937.1 kinase, PfkB family [Amedibacillus dolichus DSM 3991]
MKKLCAIGEALIDFIPSQKGVCLKDVVSFQRTAGGAPANVAAAVARLGGSSKVITQLGKDAFGDFLVATMQSYGIDTSDIQRSEEGDTALAFVSLAEDGNRDFQFYRKTSADLLLEPVQIQESMLDDCGILHFCSVDLVESPMHYAHKKLIELALAKQLTVSFDPNLRFPLWKDKEKLRQTVLEFLPYAHILKLSDEELEFISGKQTIKAALPDLFVGNVSCVIYTMGKNGARAYHKSGFWVETAGYFVDAKDTTGAGDAFIGAFLYKLLMLGKDISICTEEETLEMLRFANAYGAHTTTKQGAMSAMASRSELEQFLNQMK